MHHLAYRAAISLIAASALVSWEMDAQASVSSHSIPHHAISLPPRGAAHLAEIQAGLGTTMRVLMIAAHPDDEDTNLIAWLARGHRATTAYLSLTRGDGGQNLIGNELGEALGVIRTEELLAARRIDGAHQYFTRAFDFGFSKTTDDTYAHWPHDDVLGDVIRVVRSFRPHVIISVFWGTTRDGHGHHQVAGLLSREAFDLADDTVRFPTATFGPAWAPLKFYRGARRAPDRATVRMNVGEYNENLGMSYAEIAADSRSQHKSQGFGTIRRMGAVMGGVILEASRLGPVTRADGSPVMEGSIFDGIDTTRVVTDSDRDYLALAQEQIAVEAIAERERVAVGDSVPVTVSVFRHGVRDSAASKRVYVVGHDITQPYWLHQPRRGAMFIAGSDSVPDDEREKRSWLQLPITVAGRSSPVMVRTPVLYRYAHPVKGNVQRPLAVVPAVSVTFNRELELTRAGQPFARSVQVTVKSALTAPVSLRVELSLPQGLTTDSTVRTVALAPETSRTITFDVAGTLPAGEHVIGVTASDGTRTYRTGYTSIEYDHITPQRMYRPALLPVRSLDVALAPNINVGYIQGVGDNVAPALAELGIPVTMIDPTALPTADLSSFTAIVIGPRAYQANPTLAANNAFLLQYAREGGHLVVQYGQYEMLRPGIMPYPITLSRPARRVTEEHAPVKVLDPASRWITTPNAIRPQDFENWVQERSTYMPSTFDEVYTPVLEMHDTNESALQSALLSATYGRGRYTYVTLALFRQLPAGVEGGARIFANLLTPASVSAGN